VSIFSVSEAPENRTIPPQSVRGTGPATDSVLPRQKEFFENAAAFQSRKRPGRQTEKTQKRVEFSGEEMQTKDKVLAELIAEPISFKKVLGEL
jgi:hypothetical protein